jgi:hypothetical protein
MGFADVPQGRNPELKPKDGFKKKHPDCTDSTVCPFGPSAEAPYLKRPVPTEHRKNLLAQYEVLQGKPSGMVPENVGIYSFATSAVVDFSVMPSPSPAFKISISN